MAIEIEEIYRRYGPMIHRRCRYLLGNNEEASDAMHDVFVQILRKEETLTMTAPSSLLYKIATHVCLNKLRTRRRKPETRNETLLMTIASAEKLDEQTSQRSLLGKVFKNEQPSTRVIAVLHYVDRMTLEEVAQTVGLSVSGVRKRLRTLKKNSMELMEAVG